MQENSLNFWYLVFYRWKKISLSAELSMKKSFITSDPGLEVIKCLPVHNAASMKFGLLINSKIGEHYSANIYQMLTNLGILILKGFNLCSAEMKSMEICLTTRPGSIKA